MNDGTLTIKNSTFTGNSTSAGSAGAGGAINNGGGTLTVTGSTFTENVATFGGAINYSGTVTVTGSTFTSNQAAQGGAIYGGGPLTVSGSTFTGNSAYERGAAIFTDAYSMTVTNSILSDDSSDECIGDGCPTNNNAGNVLGGGAMFSPLGNYGGPTQTFVPLPGSPAICAGLAANIPLGVTTDQRGYPNTNSSYASRPCVDAGAVQTNYSLAFTTEPPATGIVANTSFGSQVTVDESGIPFPAYAGGIALTLTGSGTLTTGSATISNGVATYAGLQVSTAGTSDTLTATLPLNGQASPAPIVSATSSSFAVGREAQTITFGALGGQTYGGTPIALTATATSGLPVSFTVTGPATIAGSTLTIIGAGQVSVTASQPGNADFAAATSVTQSFAVSKATLTVTANNASRAYGAANPALTYAVTGFVNGDTSAVVGGTATLTTTAVSTSQVGTAYPITFSTEGLTAANYSFTYVAGAFTISGQEAQTISFGALSPQAYGASTIALMATASSGLPVSYTVTGPATIAGSTLTITGAGPVTVTASQTGNVDFAAATSITQSFTVSKATLTLTAANASRVYGAPNPALTYSVAGFVNRDTSAVVTGTATLTTAAAATSAVGTAYPIVFSTEGLTASNYSFIYVAGTLTILPPVTMETITTLVANPSTNLVAGEPITLTATVVPIAGTAVPTGTITFASPTGGSAAVSLDKTGKAVYKGVVPPAGTYTVFASYSGASGFARSTSPSITRTVSAH